MNGKALLAAAALAGALLPLPAGAGTPAAERGARAGVFVLGIDGMDPVILQRLIDEGKMPHFAALAEQGAFQSLGTSNPPQSPVAWSCFVTGMDPGGHGIYDFIHRNPRDYSPLSSATPPPSDEVPSTLDLFGYSIPLGGDELVNNRSGTPFWDHLQRAGVPTEIYRIPGNYPPTPSKALTLSGMGTVDMRGTAGTYTWYTDEILVGDLKADVRIVTPEDEDGDGFEETVRTNLRGPPDSLRKHPVDPYLTTPLDVHIAPGADAAWIRTATGDAILRPGEWSDWMEVTFEPMPMGMGALTGIVRFYLKELSPHFKLYASPVNIAPNAPAQPLTTPDDDVAVELYEHLGHYYTQGMPEEVNAYKDGLFDDDDFVKQVRLVHDDGHALLDLALRRYDPGDMTFVYLSDIDLQCHMLWHHDDPKHRGADHPARRPELAARHAGHLEDFYRGTDVVLGRVRDSLPEGTLLIVLSDHGFQPYTRKVHLNTWLREQGYLHLLPPKGAGAGSDEEAATGTLAQVDWSRTRAYGLGFNGIYLNLQGREREGIVPPGEARALADEIVGRLLELQDPQTGRRPVLRADRADQTYSGSRLAEAPDVVVGYDQGYGCSDKSTLGEITAEVFEDNLGGEFTGNHLMAPEVVPGVLLLNRPLSTDGHDLTDVTASILAFYGLPVPPEMVGRPFLQRAVP